MVGLGMVGGNADRGQDHSAKSSVIPDLDSGARYAANSTRCPLADERCDGFGVLRAMAKISYGQL